MDILSKFNEGDPEAEKPIYELFVKDLVMNAFLLTTDFMVAEELANDSFIKLFGKKDIKFENLESLKRYLNRIVHNACIDYLKKKHRDDKNQLSYQYVSESTEEIEDRSLEEQRVDMLRKIGRAIDEQPPKRKQVMVYLLREFKEPAEVALLMDIHVSGVYEHRNAFKSYLFNTYGIDGDSLPF